VAKITVKESNEYPRDAKEKFSKYYAATKLIQGPEQNPDIRIIDHDPSDREKKRVVSCQEILVINRQGNFELGYYHQPEDKYMQKKLEGDFSLLKEMKYGAVIDDLEIQQNIFKLCTSWQGSVRQQSVHKMIQSIKEDQRKILKIDGDYGPGGNPNKKLYPAFELMGMDSIFGPNKKGMNCANWCADKLYIAGIGDGSRKKPGCLIL